MLPAPALVKAQVHGPEAPAAVGGQGPLDHPVRRPGRAAVPPGLIQPARLGLLFQLREEGRAPAPGSFGLRRAQAQVLRQDQGLGRQLLRGNLGRERRRRQVREGEQPSDAPIQDRQAPEEPPEPGPRQETGGGPPRLRTQKTRLWTAQ